MTGVSFWDFPEDVQLAVLSFLSPSDAAAFACTARRAAALCSSSSPLWLAIADRRWSHLTQPRRWAPPSLPHRRLFAALHRLSPLPGFWRLIGSPTSHSLLFFDWAPSSITAWLIAPHQPNAITKIPFLYLGLSSSGDPVAFLHPNDDSSDEADPVHVAISFLGSNHIVVEESRGFLWREPRNDGNGSSPPERIMSEMYQYFANRTSPGAADRAARRQRRKKQLGKLRWEPKHFLKIENYCPTRDLPLQGLWKGISEELKLGIYLVTYDESGGISCRQVGEAAEPFSSYSPIFWTSTTTFIEPPFSREEQRIYEQRQHIQPSNWNGDNFDMESVSCILCINSSYDLVIPDLHVSSGDPRNVEGRIWLYHDGTFGFGFLRNNFIIDLKLVAINGRLLDTVEYLPNASSF